MEQNISTNSSRKWLFVALASLILLLALPARTSPVHAGDGAAHTLHLPAVAAHCTPVAPTPFGVEMYGDTGPSSPYYPFLLESGSSWVRAPINWSLIEPVNSSPSEYNWAHADRVVSAVLDACRHMIVTHASDPEWAEATTGAPLNEFGMAELAEYLGALVERYDGDGFEDAPGSPVVRHWEIYNEPDDTIPLYGGRWGHAGAEYAEMLAVVYPAIKAADPQAQVLFGGIAYDGYEGIPSPFFAGFLDNVLKAGGGDYFDVMNFHTYPPYAENWASQGPGLYEKTQYIRAKLAHYGLEKPIFITETAHHSNEAWPGIGGSHEMQMRFVAQLYTQALAADVKVMVWFALADPGGEYPFDSGLVTHGPLIERKPAFAVYQNAVAQLGHARFVRRFTLAETGVAAMEAYEFVDDRRKLKITVAWLDPVQSEESATLALAAEQAVVYDMVGQAAVVHDTDDGNDDGQIAVHVTGRPLYVAIDLPLPLYGAQAATDCDSVSEIPAVECEALVALYNSTNGPNWIKQGNWLLTNTPCSWYGITCAGGGHVTHIDIDSNRLSGSIPPEIGNFSALHSLCIPGNQLSGNIPVEIGKLSTLESLYFTQNQLSGSIPAEIGKLSNLVTLYLDGNQFSSLPAEIGKLANLQNLYLGGSQLGSVPPEIGDLSHLLNLGLSNGQLRSLPAEIGKLSALQNLYLDNNQLSSLPPEIGNLANLHSLHLNFNPSLAGPLPATLVQLSNLQSFYFNGTNFCEPGDAAFQGWLANIVDIGRTNVLCTSPAAGLYMPLIATEP